MLVGVEECATRPASQCLQVFQEIPKLVGLGVSVDASAVLGAGVVCVRGAVAQTPASGMDAYRGAESGQRRRPRATLPCAPSLGASQVSDGRRRAP